MTFTHRLLAMTFSGLFFCHPSFAQSTSPGPASIDSAEAPQASTNPDGNFFERNFSSTASIFIASNYVFRGISQTRKGAAVQGTFDIGHPSGFGAGLFVSNVAFDAPLTQTRTEADLYLLYNKSIGAWSFGAMGLWYSYPETPELNAMEYSAFAKFSFVKLDYIYFPRFFGAESKADYVRVTFSCPFTVKDTLIASAGRYAFSDETAAGLRNYLDTKLGITHVLSEFTTEFAWTDTNRKDLNDQRQNDQALTVILSRTF